MAHGAILFGLLTPRHAAQAKSSSLQFSYRHLEAWQQPLNLTSESTTDSPKIQTSLKAPHRLAMGILLLQEIVPAVDIDLLSQGFRVFESRV